MVQQEYNEKMLTLKAWAFDCSVESGYAKHPGDVDISKSSTLFCMRILNCQGTTE